MRVPRLSVHFNGNRMAHLNGIAADLAELVAQDLSVTVRGCRAGVRPDPVAANVAEGRIGNTELLGSFFQQNSAGGIVAPFGVARSAVLHRYVIDGDIFGMADERGEAGNIGEIDMIDGNAVGLFDENAVVREYAGESFVGGSERHAAFRAPRDFRLWRNSRK